MVAFAPLVLLWATRVDERVRLVPVPAGAIQPQAQFDARGALELLFFRGEPKGGDLFVATSRDGGAKFQPERRVNGEKSRAVAIGTVRAARFAIGRDDSLHVAWMGAAGAEPRAPGNATPLLVSRTTGGHAEFAPPRNVITAAVGLDGGFDVAADGRGSVAVVWHAPPKNEEGEAARRVWLARSSDDGATFKPEVAIDAERHGACACCGMRAIWTRSDPSADERLWVLYRCALHGTNRDMHALIVHGAADPVRSLDLAPWPANGCVMSTAALANGPDDSIVAAWETEGQVFIRSSVAAGEAAPSVAPSGSPGGRKHPRLAINSKGERLLCWTEGTGWERGGALAWQLFDRSGKPVEGASGRIDGVPAWSFGEPVALMDDRFVLFH